MGSASWAKILLIILQLLFVLAVPTFLVTLSVRLAVNSPRLYAYGFDRYDAVQRTGLPREELVRAGNAIIDYFNSSDRDLSVMVSVEGQQRELFNSREISHMRDVKGLVRGVYRWQWVSLGYLLGSALVGLALWRRRFWPTLARGLLWGSAFTIAALLLIALVVAVGFDALFTQFHLISFSNDFWLLDPRTDKLVQMFPDPFWRDATLFVGLGAILGAAILGGLSAFFLLRRKKALRLWSDWAEPVPIEQYGDSPAVPTPVRDSDRKR